jgi:sugar lactone lactonase YvrE
MKKIILPIVLGFIFFRTNAQCNVSISISPSSSCFNASDTLRVSGATGASNLVWTMGNTTVYTAAISWIDTALVVGGTGNSGNSANQLSYPLDMYIDRSGNIYVCDEGNNRIQKFAAGSTMGTNAVTVAGGNGPGSAANQLDDPRGLYVDAAGNIYVADSHNHRIQKFLAGSTSATNAVTVAGGNGGGSASNQLDYPQDVYLDLLGNIYVVDVNNFRIQKFPASSTSTTSGTTVAGGSPGPALNQLSQATSILIDNNNYIYVLDQTGERVLRFPPGSTSTTNGVVIAGNNGGGSAANQFFAPKGMFFDSIGNLYVADLGNNRIQKFLPGSTSATNGITILSTTGFAPGQINQPSAIYIDSSGNFYELDAGNARVQEFTIQGVNNDTAYTPTSPGIYTADVITQSGCTTVATATVYPQVLQSYSYTFCGSGSVSVGMHIYTSSGMYIDTLTAASVHGCDSVVVSHVIIYPQNTFNQTIASCFGFNTTIGIHTYTSSGTYIDTLQGASMFGCDSIVITQLTVYPLDTFLQVISICQGNSISVGAHTYTLGGVYTDTLTSTSALGCDSVVTTNLVTYQSIFSQTEHICAGGSLLIGNQIYTSSGAYSDTLAGTGVHGCDSIVNTFLLIDTFAAPTIVRINDTLSTQLYQSYQWLENGQMIAGATFPKLTITHSGVYSVIVTNALGCSDTSTTLSAIGLNVNYVREEAFLNLFPNPSSGIIYFSMSSKAKSLSIYDMDGRITYSQADVPAKYELHVEGVSKGIYNLEVNIDNLVIRRRLIIE